MQEVQKELPPWKELKKEDESLRTTDKDQEENDMDKTQIDKKTAKKLKKRRRSP